MALAVAENHLQKATAHLKEFGLTKVEETRGMLQEARDAAQARGDQDGDVEAIKVLIDIHAAKKEHSQAATLAHEAIGTVGENGKKASLSLLLAQIHLGVEGGWQQALAAFAGAQALYKQAGDKAGETEAMGLAAQLHLDGGDVATALRCAREALEISPDAVTAMHTIAQVHLSSHEFQAASDQAADMLAVCRDKGNRAGEASACLVMANAILSVDGCSVEGLNMGRKALALFQEADDVYGTQSSLHTVANGYFSRQDMEEGLKCAREALACFRQTGDEATAAALRETIEHARASTQSHRRTQPKRPFVLPPSAVAARPAGPDGCRHTESLLPPSQLEAATSGRKYWGVPTQVEADPSLEAADRPPSHSIIWGTCLTDNCPTQVCVEFGDLLANMQKGDCAKVPITVLTCGVFGRQCGEHQVASMTNVSAATIWGMTRTARQEIPSVIIQLLDFAEGMTAAEIPRAIRPQLMESAYYHRARWEPQIAEVPSLFRRELKVDALTSGGPGPGKRSDDGIRQRQTFLRKSFNWMGPSHKMDYCWYRQEWRACGPAYDDVGPMPPPPPCRSIRTC